MAPSFLQYHHFRSVEAPGFLTDWHMPWPGESGLTGVRLAGVSDAGDVVVAGRFGGNSSSSPRIQMATMTSGVWGPQAQVYAEPPGADGLYPLAAFNPGDAHIVIGAERTFQQSAWRWNAFVLTSTGGAFSKTATSLPIDDLQAQSGGSEQLSTSLTTTGGKCVALLAPRPSIPGRVISTTGPDITVTDIFSPGAFVLYPQLLEVDGSLWLFYYGELTEGDPASRTVLYRTSSDPHVGWSTPQPVTGIPNIQERYRAAVQADGSILVAFSGQHLPSEAALSRYSVYYNRFFGNALGGGWVYNTVYNPIIEVTPRLENQISSDDWYSNQVATATAGFVFFNARTAFDSFGRPFAAAIGDDDVGEPFPVGDQVPEFQPVVAAAADIKNRTTVALGGGFGTNPDYSPHFRQAGIGQAFGEAIRPPSNIFSETRLIASSPNRRSGIIVVAASSLGQAPNWVTRWRV